MLGCNSVPLFCWFHFTPQLLYSRASKSPGHLQSSLDTWAYPPGKRNTHRTPSSNHSRCTLAGSHSFPYMPVQTQLQKQCVCNGASVWVAKQRAPCPPPRHLLCSDVPSLSLSTSVPSFLPLLQISNLQPHLLTKFIC